MTQVKICGIKDQQALQAAVEGGAAFVGFVFFERSPRHILPEHASTLAATLPPSVKSVVVMVDPDDALLETYLAAFTPDYIQLHGKETVARVKEIRERFGVPVIKAVAVRSGDDIAAAGAYQQVAELLLFDAKAPKNMLPGGNGLCFDWALLRGRNFSVPWMLSGGLNAENIREAVDISGATMLDASSSLEIAPGQKDPALIRAFLQQATAAN